MPQTDVFLDQQDLFGLCNSLFHQGAQIVPDLDYPSSQFFAISDIQEFSKVYEAQKPRLFFVISERWQRCPLTMRSVMKMGKEVFYIAQKCCGPTIDIFCPFPYRSNDGSMLPAGFIAYHARFWNESLNCMESPSQFLVESYRRLKFQLTEGAIAIEQTKRRYLVTKRVLLSGIKLANVKSGSTEN